MITKMSKEKHNFFRHHEYGIHHHKNAKICNIKTKYLIPMIQIKNLVENIMNTTISSFLK